MDSILNSIKKLLGIDESDKSFDSDITIHINSVFIILKQIGFGPTNGFSITDETDTWIDYVAEDLIETVKTYMFLKVKMLFDPPSNSVILDSMKTMISELEWRLNIEADTTE